MAELTYEDYKRRLSIQELLVDAGYRLNRRDGLRYPSYVRPNARTTMSSPSSRNIPTSLPNTLRGCPLTGWSTSYADVC